MLISLHQKASHNINGEKMEKGSFHILWYVTCGGQYKRELILLCQTVSFSGDAVSASLDYASLALTSVVSTWNGAHYTLQNGGSVVTLVFGR
jgi:hypothetical protein